MDKSIFAASRKTHAVSSVPSQPEKSVEGKERQRTKRTATQGSHLASRSWDIGPITTGRPIRRASRHQACLFCLVSCVWGLLTVARRCTVLAAQWYTSGTESASLAGNIQSTRDGAQQARHEGLRHPRPCLRPLFFRSVAADLVCQQRTAAVILPDNPLMSRR